MTSEQDAVTRLTSEAAALRAEVERMTQRASEIPGLSATVDELTWTRDIALSVLDACHADGSDTLSSVKVEHADGRKEWLADIAARYHGKSKEQSDANV